MKMLVLCYVLLFVFVLMITKLHAEQKVSTNNKIQMKVGGLSFKNNAPSSLNPNSPSKLFSNQKVNKQNTKKKYHALLLR